jgi:hypothetical protein
MSGFFIFKKERIKMPKEKKESNVEKLLAGLIAEDEVSDENFNKLVAAVEEYVDNEVEAITNLFTKPAEILKPLQKMYVNEHPSDKPYIPGTTEFYNWIVEKINEKQ